MLVPEPFRPCVRDLGREDVAQEVLLGLVVAAEDPRGRVLADAAGHEREDRLPPVRHHEARVREQSLRLRATLFVLPFEVELRDLVPLVRSDDGDHHRLAPRASDLRGKVSNVFKSRGIETLSQSTSRRRAPNFFATYTNAHRRNAEFFRITRNSGSRASGSSGRRISMTCCGFTDRGTSSTIRYGSVCTPTLCPNRALMSDEMSCARVSFTFDPKHAFTIRTSRADSIVMRVSVASGASPTDARYARNVEAPCSLTGYAERSRSLRIRPTSWATSNGTGMSSPTHEGTSPISRTGSTSKWSSLKSTNGHLRRTVS